MLGKEKARDEKTELDLTVIQELIIQDEYNTIQCSNGKIEIQLRSEELILGRWIKEVEGNG